MSTRSYTGLIVLETLFDSIPTSNQDVLSLASSVFDPYVQIIESDCGTTLGQLVDVTYELEGKIELATGLPFSRARITQLLTQGVYTTSVRDLSTCISQGGVCQACYKASRQKDPAPAVGTGVQVHSEYVTYTETLFIHSGTSTVSVGQTTDLYSRAYVYRQGVLLPETSYTLSDATLTLTVPAAADGYLTIRYTTFIRAPFLFWLAGTYSGSILGIKELPAPSLTLRKRLLTSLIPQGVLESLTSGVGNLNGVPPEIIEYLNTIRDPLEKALLVLALYAVYLNVG